MYAIESEGLKLKKVVRCSGCFWLWKTAKKVGDTVTCPMCGASNKVEIDPYLMQREEKRHRKSVKIDLAVFIVTICLALWTLSLPADLATHVGTLFFSGAALFQGILVLSDYFQANEIRQQLSKSKDEED